MFPSRNQQPLFWVGGRPIHAVSFLVSLYVLATVGTALLLAVGRQDLIQLFVYNSAAVAHGELWRLITYSLINPPSISFALEIGALYFLGRFVEVGIGSKNFALFYGGLILLQGILFQLAHALGYPAEAHGMQMASLALFAAFVAMVPSGLFFFGIAARWMLFLLLGLSALQLLAEHQWTSMVQLLVLSAAAVFFMKKQGYSEPLYFFSSKGLVNPSMSKPVVLPPPKAQASIPPFAGPKVLASFSVEGAQKAVETFSAAPVQKKKKNSPILHVDQLLDKINATGMESLTGEEKERLEAARMALLERDGK